MKTLKIDMLKFNGARHFKAKDGTDHIAIPVDPNNIYRSKKGLYCSLALLDNRDGADQYGNDGFATVDLGKDRRLAGEKGPILGNWKNLETRSPSQNGAAPPTPAPGAHTDHDDGDIPF